MAISNIEHEYILVRIRFFEESRNAILRFMFTVVLAELIIAFIPMPVDNYTIWLFLIPFFLIIPFTARLTYYRSCVAYLDSFLTTFEPDKRILGVISEEVPNEYKPDTAYPFIAWLVNFEPFFLSLASILVYYIKYFSYLKASESPYSLFHIIIPIALCVIVYIIILYSYRFGDAVKYFNAKFRLILKNNPNIPESLYRKDDGFIHGNDINLPRK